MFRAVLDPQQSCVERTKFLSTLWPHTCPVSLTTNVPHQRDPFETIDELTMMQHYHPKFIVYIRVHSWYRFWQMCSDRHPPSSYQVEQLHCPKNALCSAVPTPSPTPQPLATTNLLTVSLVFCLFQNVIQLVLQNMLSFFLVIWGENPSIYSHGLTVYFFLALISSSLSGCTIIYVPVHPLKD